MNLITIDFETYYDKNYGLKKYTTEEYIRDDKFEVIGVAVKQNKTHLVLSAFPIFIPSLSW